MTLIDLLNVRVVTNLQFLKKKQNKEKKILSEKHSKEKGNKMRYACLAFCTSMVPFSWYCNSSLCLFLLLLGGVTRVM